MVLIECASVEGKKALGDGSSDLSDVIENQKQLAIHYSVVLSSSERAEIQNAATFEAFKALLVSKIPPMTSQQVSEILSRTLGWPE